MTTQVKVITTTTVGAPSSAAPQTAVAHSTAVPAGAVVLGSTGGTKPIAAADQQICTVPIHVGADNSVSFFFNGAWRRGDGSLAP